MGRLHFESLSPANYKRMTLISEVSQFGITPVPFLKHGGRCCWRGSFHVSPQQYSKHDTFRDGAVSDCGALHEQADD